MIYYHSLHEIAPNFLLFCLLLLFFKQRQGRSTRKISFLYNILILNSKRSVAFRDAVPVTAPWTPCHGTDKWRRWTDTPRSYCDAGQLRIGRRSTTNRIVRVHF